ncbi:MAG: DUF1330 domain-containing protein [Kiloniellaceae bacterium]
MAAYLIAHIDVTDRQGFAAYGAVVPAIIEQFGGRYLIRGGDVQVLEGDWAVPRLVTIEFPSAAQARRFYESPEYQEILPLRLAASRGTVVIAEGV